MEGGPVLDREERTWKSVVKIFCLQMVDKKREDVRGGGSLIVRLGDVAIACWRELRLVTNVPGLYLYMWSGGGGGGAYICVDV